MAARSGRATPPRGVRLAEAVEESIVLALFDLSNHLLRRGETLAATAGLTTQEWLVLLQVAKDPNFPRSSRTLAGVVASDIAANRSVSRANVSVITSRLKRRGLIREQRDEADRRLRYLSITAKGRKLVAMLEPSRRAANRRLLGPISAADRARFLRILRTCLRVLGAGSR
ncbi:MAG TPA: MarR family transcriptional regulator [Kofleriaceae bacterium]|nr:MarR family transcriptional regulator [Kofleriaceae bacterium]